MTLRKVKPQYFDSWGIMTEESPIFTVEDLIETAKIWGKHYEDLLPQTIIIYTDSPDYWNVRG